MIAHVQAFSLALDIQVYTHPGNGGYYEDSKSGENDNENVIDRQTLWLRFSGRLTGCARVWCG